MAASLGRLHAWHSLPQVGVRVQTHMRRGDLIDCAMRASGNRMATLSLTDKIAKTQRPCRLIRMRKVLGWGVAKCLVRPCVIEAMGEGVDSGAGATAPQPV